MSVNRWETVVALFEQALAQPAEERERFLQTATDDPALRGRIAAMLRADSAPHRLLDSPAEIASILIETEGDDRAGQRIGSYVIEREIGRGGAATVFLATDTKHHRSVALKLLHADASSALGGDRFRREIEVVAQLQHPHILPLHDSGEVDGQLYYVMPLVKGETLRDRIARDGALPMETVTRVVADVAGALDYAHRHGVVHRDVKPANILLDESHATVADFGIAHRSVTESPDQITTTGVIIGTPAYMSPEQSMGARDIDARTDVYALGCVTFEMLTGTAPFRGGTVQAIVAQHFQAEVPSARAMRAEVPADVDPVLERALAKDPASRFGSTREFADAFATAVRSLGDHVPLRQGPDAATMRRRWLASIATGIGTLALVITGWLVGARDTGPLSVAVLPFTNMSDGPANEYFSDGVTEELTGALAQVGGLRVTPRTTAFAYKGRSADITRIGRELGVDRIVEGSVRRDADQIRIVARLYSVANGEQLWNETYNRSFGAVLPLQTEIATTIAERLQRRLVPADRERLIERHTINPDAYDNYLKGRYFFDQRTAASLEVAVGHFKRALEIDSTYARAYAGLADTYSILAWTGFAAPSELFSLAERTAQRAIALDSALAESHVSLGIINTFHTWDWAAADRETSLGVRLDSTLASAWFFRTWPLIAANRHPEAMVALQRARTLDPLSLITNARIATLLAWSARYAEADSVLRKTLEINPSYPVARVQLARVLSIQGRHDEAIAALPADTVRLGSYESGIAGFVYARAGRRDAALAAARALESRAYVPAEGVAAIYAGLGDRALALTWLERAVTTRGVGLVFLEAEPMYDSLRDDPRYAQVVARIGLVRR